MPAARPLELGRTRVTFGIIWVLGYLLNIDSSKQWSDAASQPLI